MLKSHLVMISLLVFFLVAFVISILILCAVPPVDRDALTHHLAVPKLYLAHGGIYEIPSIEFSYYPMNLDLLYLAALYFGSDILPKYIHFAFALLTAFLIFRYLKKELDLGYALLGALFFLSIPVIVKLSITVYVDLGLVFFSTAALLALLNWIRQDFKWRYLFLSAAACGLALGTKYNGMIVLFILVMLVPLAMVRFGTPIDRPWWKPFAAAVFYVGISLAFFSPWMVKNYFWTGNPIYPLYNQWFNPTSEEIAAPSEDDVADIETDRASKAEQQMKWNHFLVRKLVYKESALETLLIPIRIFFQGQDDNPKYFDGKLNPFLLILPFFALLGIKSESQKSKRDLAFLSTFANLYLLFVYVQTDMRIRWIAPIIPPLVILSILGIRQLEKGVQKQRTTLGRYFYKGLIIFMAILPLGINFRYAYEQFHIVKPWDVISGKVSRADYITRFRPEYPVIAHANQVLAEDARILAFYLGNRIYYSDRRMDCNYALFFKELKHAASAESLFQFLEKHSVTHLMMRFDLFQHRIDTMLDPHEKEILKVFFQNHLRELYVQNGHGLFAVSPK